MNSRLYDYPVLNIRFPEKEIFLRLGGHLTKNRMDDEFKLKYKNTALKAFEMCRLSGRWRIFKVVQKSDSQITLNNGTIIKSSAFAIKNQHITHLWCGAVTAGETIVAARDEAENISDSVVFDAVASECTDAAMDTLQTLAKQELVRHSILLCERRFSPGYGDMSLEIQKFFFSVLKLEDLSMALTENMFMLPEKSVTAFAGAELIQQGDNL